MTQKIQKLPDALIDKIAAGEVVENPTSVAKELIENSIDAGARSIHLEFSDGGLKELRVEDDGEGMSEEDALLSTVRHATSKLKKIDDFSTLTTMGFRGEALPTIIAVSHFTMTTSEGGVGTKLVFERGKKVLHTLCARNRGTTIEVRSIFANVPARQKFQKSARFSAASLRRMLHTIALAHPEISFSLNKEKIRASSTQERIEELLGVHEHHVHKGCVELFLMSPAQAGSKRLGQYIYVNKRAVFSPLLAKAVKEGFGTRLKEQEYPRFVLFLTIDPDRVDVNVHPQKSQVRFAEEKNLFRLVQKTVEGAFSSSPSFLEKVEFSEPMPPFSPSFPPSSKGFSMPPLEAVMEEEIPLFASSEKFLCSIGFFALFQGENLLLVDLKALYARLLFDSLQSQDIVLQEIFPPIEIEMKKDELERLEGLKNPLFEYRILGRLLVVDALSPLLERSDFSDLLAAFQAEKKWEERLARYARKRKAPFSPEEAKALWSQHKKSKDRFYDPKGKWIFRTIEEEDLAKLLERHV